MRPSFDRLLLVVGASLICGQLGSGIGSARAEEPAPVAVDLVELALELAQARGNAQILDEQFRISLQQQRKGYARLTASDHEAVRIDRDVAHQKAELLRLIVQAELAAATTRIEFLKSQLERGAGATIVDVRAAELRQAFLRELLKVSGPQASKNGDSTSQTPPFAPSETTIVAARPEAEVQDRSDGKPAATRPRVERHVVVFGEDGQFGGWPANHGMWMWGNEILVGFSIGEHKDLGDERHNIDRDKPEYHVLARSLDGGETWTIENPQDKGMLINEGGMRHGTTDSRHTEPDPAPITEPIDFTHPDFCMTLRFQSVDAGTSRLYYSYDRGHNWKGPFEVPSLGQPGIMARTDYLVNGPQDCHFFLTASKTNRREGRVIAARTTDGGVNWKFLSYVGPEPKGFAIMPSTVRLSPTDLVMAVRRRAAESEPRRRWTGMWASHDNGLTWEQLPDAVDDLGEGNPPSMIQLADGRLCLTYGVRKAPYEVQAKFSSDGGQSWSEPIVLITGGGGRDLGYPRTLQRPDGKIVTAYYFQPSDKPYRKIIATIWEPGSP